MRRGNLIALGLIVILLFAAVGCGGGDAAQEASTAAGLAEQAQAEMEQGNLTEATELYEQAREAYDSEGEEAGARECLNHIQDMSTFALIYPTSEDELRSQLAEAFPTVPEEEREAWIASGELEHMVIDGEPMYFSDVTTNIKYRDVELFRQDAKLLQGYTQGYELLKQVADEPSGPSWQPYDRPITYQGTHIIDVPRDKLPASGLLKLWIPIPIITGPQPAVRVTAIVPDTYVAQPPSFDGDLGLVYMEVPLDELAEDLEVSVQFEFDHYEQRFVIDPSQVGEYDTGSALYEEYTASAGNIAVTPEIEETARQVVGDEVNPYLAAKKIYDYVVGNIAYSLMPHLALWPRGEPESVYVHEHRCGDCGAQSIYFSALCRAVGIPARTTGGWQLFGGHFGDHFWAEFYLPYYGWLPVDTTAAEMADYVVGLSEAEVKDFHDFFFANQDHYRCVVQHDVDETLSPPAMEPIICELAIQQPVSNCDTMEDMPDLTIYDQCSMQARILGE